MPYVYLVQSNLASTKTMDVGHDQRAHGRTVSQIFDNWKFAEEAVKSINGFIEKQIERDTEVRFGEPAIHTLYYWDASEAPASKPNAVEDTRHSVRALMEDVIYRTSELFWLNEKGKPTFSNWEDDDGFNWTRRGVTE